MKDMPVPLRKKYAILWSFIGGQLLAAELLTLHFAFPVWV